AEDLHDAAKHHVGKAADAAMDVAGDLHDAASHHAAWVANASAEDLHDAAKHHVGKAADAVMDAAGDAHDAAKHHAQKAAGHVANAVGAAWGALAGAFGGGGGNSEERALEQQPPQASRTQPGLLVARDPVPPAQDKPTLSLQGKPAAVLPAWSQAQRAWCCENRGVGCTTTTPKC
ncbi:unnamed protein product, partial [Prorocentrum cordatum]